MRCFGRDSLKRDISDEGPRHGIRRPGTDSNPEAMRRQSPPGSSLKPVPVSVSDPGVGQFSGSYFSYLPTKEPRDLREFTLAELKAATKNFALQNRIGEGGFGHVYKGVIKHKSTFHDGEEKLEVAVKRLNKDGAQGHKEWMTEVHFLGLVDNPYLVKLIGYCADDDARGMQRLLVYEYMANKGLDDHIFRLNPPILSWQTRVKIALGAARGLAYLHEEMEVQVIFRDFKTSNVLLDDEFNPKLSDFGLARQGPDLGMSHVTTAVKGTYGYAAPEYIQTGHLTSKSDVWSFGVVMLEMLTGRRALDLNRPKMEQRLLEWVKPYITDPRKFHHVIDPQLEWRYSGKAVLKFGSIATQCLVKQPKGRPKMSDVVEGLKKVMELTYLWETPASQPMDVGANSVRGAVIKEGDKDGALGKRSALKRLRTPTCAPDPLLRSPLAATDTKPREQAPSHKDLNNMRRKLGPPAGKSNSIRGRDNSGRLAWLPKMLFWSS